MITMITPALFGCGGQTEEDEEVQCLALNAVAVQLAVNGQWHKALNAWRKLLTMQRKRLGSVHEDVATTLNNIGVALCHIKESSSIEIEMIFEEALWIRRSVWGEDDNDETAEISHNLSLFQHNDEVRQGLKPGGEEMDTFKCSVPSCSGSSVDKSVT